MSSTNGAPRGGIDLGGTKIQAVVVDADHAVIGQARHPTPDRRAGPQDVAAAMAAAMTEAAEQAGVETDALAGVGRRLARATSTRRRGP